MILIYDKNTGGFLCRDGRIRHSWFGTYSECIKIYKSISWAKKKLKDLKEHGHDCLIIQNLSKDVTVEASGHFIRRESIGNGYEKVERRRLTDITYSGHDVIKII
jgi:hypothetical protein